LFKAPVAISYN